MKVLRHSIIASVLVLSVSSQSTSGFSDDLATLIARANRQGSRVMWNGYDPITQVPPPPPDPIPVRTALWTPFKEFKEFRVNEVVPEEHKDRVFIQVEAFEVLVENGDLKPDLENVSEYVQLRHNRARQVHWGNLRPDHPMPSVSYKKPPAPEAVAFVARCVSPSGTPIPGPVPKPIYFLLR